MAENTNVNNETVLSVRNLNTSFFTDSGEVRAVNGVSFELGRGKILGVVGYGVFHYANFILNRKSC